MSQRWPITAELKQLAIERLTAIVQDPKSEPATLIQAVKVLLQMEAQCQADEFKGLREFRAKLDEIAVGLGLPTSRQMTDRERKARWARERRARDSAISSNVVN